jgi:hypothetical protein
MAAQNDAQPIRLRLICDNPPPEAYEGKATSFGLQDKLGSLLLGDTAEDGSLVYEFELDVKPDAEKPVFIGVYAQGTPRDRFLYLSWGYIQDDQWQWIRRLKIPLTDITVTLLTEARQQNSIIEGRVDGHGSGTIPLLGEGWHITG